jgi:predicted phosphodiesterase
MESPDHNQNLEQQRRPRNARLEGRRAGERGNGGRGYRQETPPSTPYTGAMSSFPHEPKEKDNYHRRHHYKAAKHWHEREREDRDRDRDRHATRHLPPVRIDRDHICNDSTEEKLQGLVIRRAQVPALLQKKDTPGVKRLRIVCISDTHNRHRDLPPLPQGDDHILIHCGDFTYYGRREQIEDFNEWLGTLNYSLKLVISGNHERLCGDRLNHDDLSKIITNAQYITHSWLELKQFGGLKIFASSWGGNGIDGYDWSLFTHATDDGIEGPRKADILITHIPPKGILDRGKGELRGHVRLLQIVAEARPSVHLFGHVHKGGIEQRGETTFMNAAIHPSYYTGPFVFDYYY